MKIKSLVVLFFLICIPLLPQKVNSEKIGIMLVLGQNEMMNSESIQKIIEWKTRQGFEVWSISADQFESSLHLKEYLINFYKSHPNFKYAILPPTSFFGKIKYKLGKTIYESISDKFFENLDDDLLFQPEIMIGRASMEELLDISVRQNMNSLTANIGFPATNYDRWACIPGECLAYTACDPSYLGNDIKKLMNRNNIAAYTFFEQEGIKISRIKPDFPLNEENIKNNLETSNLIFYLNTLEPLLPKPEGYVMYTTYNGFYRAIWKNDTNDDHFITDSELEITPFFEFSQEKSTVNRIGFFPLFANEKISLNQFSSLIGIQAMDGCLYVPDVGDGMTPSAFALYRLMMENLIKGRTVGESIQVFNPYTEKYAHDIYQQEYLALGLFVRGDPTLSISDLIEKAALTLLPEEVENQSQLVVPMNKTKAEFIIKNSGSGLLPFRIEYDENYLTVSPAAGSLEAGNEKTISVTIKMPTIVGGHIKKTSSPKKKHSQIQIKTNPRTKILSVIWYGP